MDCAFRFIDDADKGVIKPVFKGDPFYIFASEIRNEKFFRYIHPAFLTPYLIYGGFAYELAMEMNVSWSELIKMDYQISLPIKLPGLEEYIWYLQKSRILKINEKNGIMSR